MVILTYPVSFSCIVCRYFSNGDLNACSQVAITSPLAYNTRHQISSLTAYTAHFRLVYPTPPEVGTARFCSGDFFVKMAEKDVV